MTTMTCQEIQNEMIAHLADQLSEGDRKMFAAHLDQCLSCSKDMLEFERLWNTLDNWVEQPLPQKIKDSILSNAHEAVLTADADLIPDLRGSLRRFFKSMIPILMGLLTTIIFAVILSFRTDLELIPPLGLTAAGALWTGLFALVFYLFSMGSRVTRFAGVRSPESKESSWKFLAQASLVAIGIFFFITIVSPLPHSVRFCSNYQLTQPLFERLSIGGAYFLFGALYALIPMGIATYLCASRSGNSPLLRGSLAGGVFMALLIPGIFLQCAPFALGVVLGWFGGALVGSVIGGAVGYWVRHRFA